MLDRFTKVHKQQKRIKIKKEKSSMVRSLLPLMRDTRKEQERDRKLGHTTTKPAKTTPSSQG